MFVDTGGCLHVLLSVSGHVHASVCTISTISLQHEVV